MVLDSQPVGLIWERRKLTVTEIIDHWSEHGRWWDGDVACNLYLASTTGGQFLLCLNIEAKTWYAKPVQ